RGAQTVDALGTIAVVVAEQDLHVRLGGSHRRVRETILDLRAPNTMKPRTVALAAASERCAPRTALTTLPRPRAHAPARAAAGAPRLPPGLPLRAGERVSGEGAPGLSATLDKSSGRYEIADASLGWRFAGRLAQPPAEVASGAGRDEIGSYQELRFRWRAAAVLIGSIRAYRDCRVVLLSLTTSEVTPNDAAAHFPEFVELPARLMHFS